MTELPRFGRIQTILIASIMLIASQAYAGSPDELLVKYSFNEGAFNQNNAAIDTTGQGIEATVYGTVVITGGNIGNRIHLDSVGEYLSVNNPFYNDQLNPAAVTIAAWVKPQTLGTREQYLVSKLDTTFGTGYALSIDANSKLHGQVYLDGLGYVHITGTTSISNATETHVAFSYDGNQLQLFVDGVADATPVSAAGDSIAPSSAKLTIGALSAATVSNEYTGFIDEIYIWDALPADIDQYASAYGEPDLVLYQSFDSAWAFGMHTTTTGGYVTPNINANNEVPGRFASALTIQGGSELNEEAYYDTANMGFNFEQGHISLWYQPEYGPDDRISATLFETDDKDGTNYGGSGKGIWLYRWCCSESTEPSVKKLQAHVQNTFFSSQRQEPAGAMTWEAGTWHKVELIWDTRASQVADKFIAYVIDGDVADITSGNWVPGTEAITKLYIGNSPTNNRPMRGAIDELKIYSKPQYDTADFSDKIAALRRGNAGDGTWQVYETVYDSADAVFPDTALQAEDPVAFYKVPSFAPVYAGTVPDANSNADLAQNDVLNYSAATNDFESLFFSIYSQTDADDVSITLTDLTGPGGVVSTADMRLHVVKEWWQLSDQGGLPFRERTVPSLTSR
jgi:hypothetical protein